MAAGLGFKDFVTGEVLTASDVDGYLMQGIWVFASAAARDAAVTSPQEGNFAYLKDTNTTTYYTGSAWTNLDTTGMVNPMTTTGDTIYSSSGSTPARLGIGSTGQVLTVAGGVPSWATPAGGGMTLLSTTTLSGSSTTVTGISQSYKTLFIVVRNVYSSSGGSINLRVNADTGSNYYFVVYTTTGGGSSSTEQGTPGTYYEFSHSSNSSGALDVTYAQVTIPAYTETRTKQFNSWHGNKHSGGPFFKWGCCNYSGTAAITEITLTHQTPTAGEVLIYGV